MNVFPQTELLPPLEQHSESSLLPALLKSRVFRNHSAMIPKLNSDMPNIRILSAILAAATLCWAASSLSAADCPNILLFTADDLHAESLGVYGGKPADLTPNLDAFAAESLLFNRAHVNVAICAPCRAVIATGRYSHRSGAMGFMPAREDVPDIVTRLQAGGYHTWILGKYGHSTPKKSMKWDYHFDQKDLGNGRNPDLYKQRAETFFKQSKDAGKPFYFMVNSHDPHRPYCDPEKLTKGAAMPSRTYKPSEVTVPGFLPDLPGVRAEMGTYLNSTRRLDDTFGATMQALKHAGVADNTLVLFITDNGIAVPFAKCNTWFHSSHSPLLVRWPGVVKPETHDDSHFVSVVDFFPTFLEVTSVKGPDGLDGRSFLSLLKGESQKCREHVFTQIDSKAGGEYVPMRAVQNANYGYIYNPFSDGKYWYRNNNEGKTMAAMNKAAKDDPAIAARIDLFRHRVPEEFYNLEKDPNCLINLIDDPKHAAALKALQTLMVVQMKKTQDPMLPAFQNRNNQAKVDEIMVKTYGPRKPKKEKKNKDDKKKKNRKKAM
jgi:N-sulfoglucosamine sulfohydrolase